MKIVQIEKSGQKCLGLLKEDKIHILKEKNIFQLIEEKEYALSGEIVQASTVTLLAPIEYPRRNIICLGKNYSEHAKELEGKTSDLVGIPEDPIYFSKFAYPAIGDGGDIIIDPAVTDSVDYEVELAVVIGKSAKKISASDVKDHIFGYTIINDVSARNLQMKHIQWVRGKSLDTFTPMGPCLVTADEIQYPPVLDISCSVNGEVRQSSKTDAMIFDIDYVVSELSQSMTLYPGDIIITGTPEGVGMGFDPPKYLKAGDVVVCEIEGIGKLTNYVK